jgi:serine/threonine-protein kinase HipA
VGDIDVQIPGVESNKPVLSIGESREIAVALLKGEKLTGEPQSAIAGAQPKFSLGQLVRSSRNSRYIIKFDPPEYPNLSENEHAMMRLAQRCKIEVADTRLQRDALIVRRFDRIYDQNSRQMNRIHLEDMLQVMDRFPNSKYALEYGELLTAMSDLGVPKASLLSAIRLYVYSYIIGNGDLHAKNVSVIFGRDEGQWRISPAYDLLSNLPYGETRMALALENEALGRFTMSDFIEIGRKFDLEEKAITEMVNHIRTAIVKYAPGYLQKVVSPEVVETILDRATSLSC